ncbi:MAG: beta-lactamase family protein [candidate division KSB1 bacterium]|nr:beta-lactamase family protein [candidate division KSB1 bacterium]
MRTIRILAALVLCVFSASGVFAGLPRGRPEQVGMSAAQLALADSLVLQAIRNQEIPGAVLLVMRHGRVVVHKAFGNCQLVPVPRPMSEDMIFDLASITKPVATATSVMILVEQGKLRLEDKVKLFVPSFTPYIDEHGASGEDACIWHLLTHTSGLPPYTNADSVAKRYGSPCRTDSLVAYISRLKKLNPPGKAFHYSCLGFITLAHIVHKVSGHPLDEFARTHIFEPLGMRSTTFCPDSTLLPRVVPTEVVQGAPLCGVVHDPLARLQGGVSGNAGLFSSAEDLAVFAQMMLSEGEYGGRRILSPLAVRLMTSVYPKVAEMGRGLGWDVRSVYASNAGDLFPGGYGHTGYTGTSIWIDPTTDTVVILLTNRVHPKDVGSVVRLRSLVANVVAGAIVSP